MKQNQDRFKKLLEPHTVNQIQNAYLFLKHLDRLSISPSEFKAFAKKLFKERAKITKEINKRLEKIKVVVPCPECGKEVVVQPINIPIGKNNVNGWRSVVRCIECTYESYSVMQAGKRVTRIKRNRRII